MVEGPVLAIEALSSARAVTEVFADEALHVPDLEAAAIAAGVELTRVAAGGLDQILSTRTPQPVAAIVETVVHTVDDLPVDRPVLVAVDAQDPGNAGALWRTAEASGCGGLVLAGNSVDSTNPKVVRAAAGAALRLPVVASPEPIALFAELRAAGHSIVASVVRGARSPETLDLTNAAIVLGNEANGLSQDVIDDADAVTTIELAGPTESLNVAAAGAVLCFESLRQRRVRVRRDGNNANRQALRQASE